MELKLSKEKLLSEKTIFTQSYEIPLETEFSIPENALGIARILKCMGNIMVSSKSISGQTLKLEGIVLFTIIYAGENGELCSCTEQLPYIKNIEIDSDCDASKIKTEASVEFLNCRAVTARRLEIRGAACIETTLYCLSDLEIICDAEDENIQLKKGKTEICQPTGYVEKTILIEEELQVAEGDPVCSCIRSTVVPIVSQCRVMSGKVMVKGEAAIRMLCCDKNGKPLVFSTTIPFSQMTEPTGADDECRCEGTAKLCSFDLKPRTGSDGSFTSVVFTAKILLTVSCSKKKDIEYVEDAYSKSIEIEMAHAPHSYQQFVASLNDSFLAVKELDFTEGSLDRIVDIWCETPKCNSRMENGILIASGTVRICILGYDTDGETAYHERPVDYEYRFEPNDRERGVVCEPEIKAISCNYAYLDSDKIEVRIELSICGDLMSPVRIDPVSELIVLENAEKVLDSTAFYLYFASPGESVWDIAKRYRSPMNELQELNGLEDDTIESNMGLIIPV